MTIKLIIAEDDATARSGIRLALKNATNLKVIGETASGQELVEMDLSDADLVLLDLGLNDLNGTLALKSLKQNWPHLKVLILTTHLQNHLLARVIRMGVDGYLIKEEVRSGRLLEAIPVIMEGGQYFSPTVGMKAQSILNIVDAQKGRVDLNDIGHVLWATGYYTLKRFSRAQIAKRMNLSTNSVRNNKVRLADKLGLKGSAEKDLITELEGNLAYWILMMDSLNELQLSEVD